MKQPFAWSLMRPIACMKAVSYTHLDVYKRQGLPRAKPLQLFHVVELLRFSRVVKLKAFQSMVT